MACACGGQHKGLTNTSREDTRTLREGRRTLREKGRIYPRCLGHKGHQGRPSPRPAGRAHTLRRGAKPRRHPITVAKTKSGHFKEKTEVPPGGANSINRLPCAKAAANRHRPTANGTPYGFTAPPIKGSRVDEVHLGDELCPFHKRYLTRQCLRSNLHRIRFQACLIRQRHAGLCALRARGWMPRSLRTKRCQCPTSH